MFSLEAILLDDQAKRRISGTQTTDVKYSYSGANADLVVLGINSLEELGKSTPTKRNIWTKPKSESQPYRHCPSFTPNAFHHPCLLFLN